MFLLNATIWPFAAYGCCFKRFVTYSEMATADQKNQPVKASRQCVCVSDVPSSPLYLHWPLCFCGVDHLFRRTPIFPALKPLATIGVSNNRRSVEGRWSFSVLLDSVINTEVTLRVFLCRPWSAHVENNRKKHYVITTLTHFKDMMYFKAYVLNM